MEKLTVATNFQKCIDALKNTECSKKEKLLHFAQIADCIVSPSLQSNTKYSTHLSSAITILLMFCEEMDSVIRMNAEENLNKIVRFCEHSNIVRIQFDLYHEIKKNGNERSLRICLNLFAYYCHLIKQRKVKPYALNLLPCIYGISKRKETLVIETLSEFLKSFCKYLQICLNENEVVKLIEVFLNDTISECAVKRRCASNNVVTLIEHSRRKELMTKHALNKSLELLVKDQSTKTIIGVLGFLRILIPILLQIETCDCNKIIEIYDVCLHLLHDNSHTIINASLEVINIILNNANSELKKAFTSWDHIEIIRKRKSLRNIIFNLNESNTNSRKSSAETIKNENKFKEVKMECDGKASDSSTLNKIEKYIGKMEIEKDSKMNKEYNLEAKQEKSDEKSLTYSDMEMDSFKSIDFESEVAISQNLSFKDKKSDTASLKSQKSTESIGSFINSLLSHTNTDTVSKFFRAQKSGSTPNTPKSTKKEDNSFVRYPEGDNLSLVSIDSHISFVSQMSSYSTIDAVQKSDQTIQNEAGNEDQVIVKEKPEVVNVDCHMKELQENVPVIEVNIGSIFDQDLVFYTARFITYKFLLTGIKHELTSEHLVRVSIKNLSLSVVANCIIYCPQLLISKLANDEIRNVERTFVDTNDTDNTIQSDETKDLLELLKECTEKPNDGLLDIKDDHFGVSTCSYKELLSPLSKSDNTFFTSKVKNLESNVKKDNEFDREFIDKSQHMSQSEIIQIKQFSHQERAASSTFKSEQFISDILLYYNYDDPVLRKNVQLIIGNFIVSVLRINNNYTEFLQLFSVDEKEQDFVELNTLLMILLKGLSDKTHTVVKQSLVSIENALPFLLAQNLVTAKTKKTKKYRKTIDCGNILLDCDNHSKITIENIIDKLLLVYENKYWVVQCKYCDLISKLDFQNIKLIYGFDRGQSYEEQFLEHIYSLIGDRDIRIQKSAVESLCQYIEQRSKNVYDAKLQNSLLKEFVRERIFLSLPMPLCDLKVNINNSVELQKVLGKVFYRLTNKLLELDDKNQQVGTIIAILELVQKYTPIQFNSIWTEFNLLEICLTFVNNNYATGTDLTCQNNLIRICTHLLTGKVSADIQIAKYVDDLLVHILKILNIYHHVFTNMRPIFISKGQKHDFFIGSMEFQAFNNLGYFGNDYFYLKIYNLIKISYESYKISVNEESGLKIMILVKTCLYSLAVILEMKLSEDTSDSIKLIEEVLTYLSTLINFTPRRCVICIKQLLKYMFSMNFISRTKQYEYFTKILFEINDPSEVSEVFDMVKKFSIYKPLTMSSGDKFTNLSNYIKIFEPIVIQCLKLFTKSNSEVQSAILDMLCQALEYKVNYCLLDANNVFIDFVLKLLELIETGSVRNSDVVIPSIIKFLFYLSKQKDKKLITIPIIINITDTLLANSTLIKSSSTLALKEMAYEFFFEQTLSISDDIIVELNTKENNTQKEVAFSMLIKFLDTVEIQKVICSILIFNKSNLIATENELYVNLLQLFDEHKKILTDHKSYNSLNLLFKTLKKNIIFDSRNFEKLLVILFNNIFTDKIDFSRLSLITIFLENAIMPADELYLLNHVKMFLQNSSKFNNIDITETSFLGKSFNEIILHSILFMKTQADNEMFFEIFSKFLTNMLCLSKFPIIMGNFKRDYLNRSLIEKIFALTLQNFKIVLLFTEFLFSIDWEKQYIFEQLSDLNDSLVHTKLKTHIIRKLCTKHTKIELWNCEDINYIVENFMQILLVAGRKFLIDLAASEIYSIKLLNNFRVLLMKNIPEDSIHVYLDILENCHVISIPNAIEFLMENFLCDSYNVRITRRSVQICCMKLNELKTVSVDEIHKIMSELQYKIIFTKSEKLKANDEIYQDVKVAVNDLLQIYSLKEVDSVEVLTSSDIHKYSIDDNWFFEQMKYLTFSSTIDNQKVMNLLNEIKSEKQLSEIFTSPKFNNGLLKTCIHFSIDKMANLFKNDCMQYNPHLNYLKIQPLLKVSLNSLSKTIETILSNISVSKCSINELKSLFLVCDFHKSFKNTMNAVISLIESIDMLENICLIYIESKFIEKWFKENLLKLDSYELFIKFSTVCMMYAEYLMINENTSTSELHITIKCVDCILSQKYLWTELNQPEKYTTNMELILNVVHMVVKALMENSSFTDKYENPNLFKNFETNNASADSCMQAVFVAKFMEIENDVQKNTFNIGYSKLKKILSSVAISILRTDLFYFLAITPYELLANCNIDFSESKLNRLPSIPIEHLNDVEVVENFVKRINIFGYSSRHHFEEFFMTLLVLVNNENDINLIDAHEEYRIKSICLSGITELLISCKIYSQVGCRNGKFYHFPRISKIKSDTISIKKLHKVLLLLPGPNIFYQPNLERTLKGKNYDNIIATSKFLPNQMEMNCIWQSIEETNIYDVSLKNSRYITTMSGIDLKSSVQLIFDVFAQLIENDYVLILPHLIKLCEVCENRDQFRWIKDTTLKLHEIVQMENAVCQQSIIFCLCKSYAVLVPSLNETTHLVTIIQTYLKSTHLFVRNATLKGLLCLLESFVKTNTTIGSLSEELSLIRNVVVNYVIKYGVIEESTAGFSNGHTKLVWTLNFYLIETTSKFVPDCNLLSNTIISANNILKRTINLDQYLCILHGLERLVATNVAIKMFREKIEKIALDLVKLENEKFSIPALKLLITCMYIGSAEQLENTEFSNGIVQDEPEVMVQSTEKIDVLFQRIKTSTPNTAILFGDVLCQITRDLVPPNEILTKVIKELLTLSQPHCEVIAKIVFQVFRSAIDSSYLPLLQDWLICSLPNFISFPVNKAVWCLTVIFISASINLHLIKIFPEVLAKYNILGDREIFIFTLGSKDFYDKLNHDQKIKFKSVINSGESDIFKTLVTNL